MIGRVLLVVGTPEKNRKLMPIFWVNPPPDSSYGSMQASANFVKSASFTLARLAPLRNVLP